MNKAWIPSWLTRFESWYGAAASLEAETEKHEPDHHVSPRWASLATLAESTMATLAESAMTTLDESAMATLEKPIMATLRGVGQRRGTWNGWRLEKGS